MSWQLRHQGSPKSLGNLLLQQIVDGLRDGKWEATDEVKGPGEKTWQSMENHPQLAELVEQLETPPPPRHDEGTNLDFNALIDVCLVLLIFFILTTTYAAAVQKVVPLSPLKKQDDKGIPRVKPSEINSRMVRIRASLDAKGRPKVTVQNRAVDVVGADDHTIDVDKLRVELAPFVTSADSRKEVFLEAEGVSWGTVIAIQDAAQAAGLTKVWQNYK